MISKPWMLSVSCALSMALPASLSAQAVQLRDGSMLVGKVQDANGDGFSFRRLDTGGLLRLRWSQLTRHSAERIKAAEGLLVEDDEVILVTADVILHSPGEMGIRKMVGRITDQDDDSITMRRRGSTVKIRRSTIKGLSQTQIAPQEIFTVDEYYLDLVRQAAPGEDADKHFKLAERLLKVRDYEHATEHLERAKQLGGGRQPKQLDAKIIYLAKLKESAAERRLLDEIRTWQNRGDFPRAMSKLAEFKQTFPETKLQADLEKTERRLLKAREHYLVRRTAVLWYKYTTQLARSKSRDKKLTLAQARTYAEGDMGKEIRERISKALDIDVPEVEAMWAKRIEHRAADSEKYYFSVGSWVLGEDAILKDTKQGDFEKQGEDKKSAEDKERERIVRRIQEAIKRARRGNARGGSNQRKQVTDEEWWQSAPRDIRFSFLRAYYAEHGGDLELVRAFLKTCPNCAGRGKVAEAGTTGGTRHTECGVCHGTRFQRYIRAR